MASLTVPFTGSNVVAQGEGPSRDSAPVQRKSLHTVRMAPQTAQADYEPQWNDKGQVKWVPVAPPEEPAEEPAVEDTSHSNGLPGGAGQAAPSYDALAQQVQMLTQSVQQMMQGQGGQQQPQGPQAPNPEEYDFYEPKDVKAFQAANNAYIQQMVQQSVQSALDPHRDTMRSAEYSRQYNSVLADHGNDPNFKPFMDAALNLVASSNEKFSIPEAYNFVASSQITSPQQTVAQPVQQVQAKPAQRTLTAQEAAQKREQANSLPPRNGVSGAGEPALPQSLMNVGALGRIMLHNQQTGRARPI